MEESLRCKLTAVQVFAMDVDGVLTDGGLYFGSDGSELKRFHVHDGLGLVMLQQVGIRALWLSGRQHEGVRARASELGVYLVQGVHDKSGVLRDVLREWGIDSGQVAYMGDDWNDYEVMRVVGVRLAPCDATERIKRFADYVTNRPGGHGAVREACELILEAQGRLEEAFGGYISGQ
ncbi:3-deoxy-D-manno-octulosonate 8-phosphate phosphatase, YrbI family [Chthonomonas calidirosea]|uniref:KdsC family phosphatase n=1 Tax=Chthonomonas calidirosea TaxID=454171 RepID=UPI0006DD3F56|nr:HAD hydrolase family protein [Chthonomonas calidirosea]CEK14028.1 3-deoxy-D-manno-octulosonate 8-phosphate phosphatase, YrbI family [Chthonomonas calidirosea]